MGDYPIASSLWFRISKETSLLEIDSYLESTLLNLKEIDDKAYYLLVDSQAYKSLKSGAMSSGIELKDGPLGVLLLFSLREYFWNKPMGSLPIGVGPPPDTVQIADDNNNLLPDRYDEIADVIKNACLQWKIDEDHQTKINIINNIKQYAIAIGCIKAPVDLTIIKSDTKAAFF